jgi:hypothetical protein
VDANVTTRSQRRSECKRWAKEDSPRHQSDDSENGKVVRLFFGCQQMKRCTPSGCFKNTNKRKERKYDPTPQIQVVQVPRNIRRWSSNRTSSSTLWQDSVKLEIKKALTDLGALNSRTPTTNADQLQENATLTLIFGVADLRHKSRLVAGGHLVVSGSDIYSSTVR